MKTRNVRRVVFIATLGGIAVVILILLATKFSRFTETVSVPFPPLDLSKSGACYESGYCTGVSPEEDCSGGCFMLQESCVPEVRFLTESSIAVTVADAEDNCSRELNSRIQEECKPDFGRIICGPEFSDPSPFGLGFKVGCEAHFICEDASGNVTRLPSIEEQLQKFFGDN